MVVHVQDPNVTDSAESLTHQEPDGNVLDTSAGEEQECLCSGHAAKPEVLSPQGSIPQDYSEPPSAGLQLHSRKALWPGALAGLSCFCRAKTLHLDVGSVIVVSTPLALMLATHGVRR